MKHKIKQKPSVLIFTLALMMFVSHSLHGQIPQANVTVFRLIPQVKIRQVIFNPGSYNTLKVTDFQGLPIDGSVSVDTKHTVLFTISDAEGEPVQGLPISFSIQPLDDTAATGTFNPPIAITDQDGNVQTQVTFGSEPGDIRLVAKVDTERIVEIVEFELILDDTDVDSVIVKGIGSRFAYTSTTQPLVFTAIDTNGKPVPDKELTFSARSARGSAATATFLPTVATTDQKGEARTQITFGAKPGGVHLTVQAGPAVEQVNITETRVNLGSQVKGTFTGLQVGDSVDVGSTHTLVFTAKGMRGRPVSGLPLAFAFDSSAVELEAMFNPIAAVTDRKGEVRTQVTFGQEPGDFQLIVSMDPQRVIVFSEPEFRLGATNITNLEIQGMEKGFAEPGSSIKLVLTARDAVGRRVAGEELVFAVDTPPSSGVTALFDRVKVKTNKKGIAQTQVTFGSKPGLMRLIVKSGITIDAFVFDLAPYGTLELTKGLQIGDAVKVNSTHDLVFTATDDNGKPLPWLPLRLDAVDVDIFAHAATFTPTPRVVTNKNGKARTSITFGDVHEDVRLVATLDRRQMIEFPNPNPKIALNNSKIDRVTVQGIEQGFARVGTTRPLVFTATDATGAPVKGVKFGFGFRTLRDSGATATFEPATVTTDGKGQARTDVTFGPNSGNLRFAIQPPSDKVTIDAVHADFNLPLLGDGELTYTGFKIGDAFKIGSTHNFVFTATKANGDVVPWLPLRFDAVYVDGAETQINFSPATVTTNKNGKARINVAFRGEPGNIHLIAEVDREQIVVFSEPQIILNNSGVAQIAVKGIEQGFARVGTTRPLVFTATDATGAPVADANLTFGFEGIAGSNAKAMFDPGTATANENGKASTRMTLGQKPGELVIEVIAEVRRREPVPPMQAIYWTFFDYTSTDIHGTTALTGRRLKNWEIRSSIQSANLNGSNTRDLVSFEEQETAYGGSPDSWISNIPNDIALDIVNGQMYWTDENEGSIYRVDLNGANTEKLVTMPKVDQIALDVASGRMYWNVITDSFSLTNALYRANLDGTNIEMLGELTRSNEFASVRDLALDPGAGKIYWSDGNSIFRANIGGANGENLVSEEVIRDQKPIGINLDVGGDKIYWANGWDGIWCADLEGSNPEQLIGEAAIEGKADTGAGNYIMDVAVDVGGDKIYWIGGESSAIQRANLDGSHIETIKVTFFLGGSFKPTSHGRYNDLVLSPVSPFPDSVPQETVVDPATVVRVINLDLKSVDPILGTVSIVSGIKEGAAYPVGSTQELRYKITDKNGDPVEGVWGYFSTLDVFGSAATVTFEPQITDQDGVGKVNITFGPEAGPIDIRGELATTIVEIDSIVFEPRSNSDVTLEFDGIEQGSIFPANSTQALFCKVKGGNGNPLPDRAFTFHAIPVNSQENSVDSSAIATFGSPIVFTSANGWVGTNIIFGPQGGKLRIIVREEGDMVKIREISFQPRDDGGDAALVDGSIGRFKTLGRGGIFPVNSTQKLRYTVFDRGTGNPLPKKQAIFTNVSGAKDSPATATINPRVVISDERGLIEAEVTFGPHAGTIDIVFTVGDRVIGLCGATAPSREILSFAEDLEDRGYLSMGLPRSWMGGASPIAAAPSKLLNVIKEGSTTSLAPPLRWSPISTVAKDVGITVITVKFLDGTPDQKEKMKAAFAEWQTCGGIYFLYDQPGESDIRVTFDPDRIKEEGVPDIVAARSRLGNVDWIEEAKHIGFWDEVATVFFDWFGYEAERKKVTQPTGASMWIKTDVFLDVEVHHGIAMHEIGHALGFYHPHSTSTFHRAFVSTETEKVTLPSTGSVDPDSIMTYSISASELTARPGASPFLQQVAKDGIPNNDQPPPPQQPKLSEGDKAAVSNVYGPPTAVYKVEGKIHIDGRDHEWERDHEDINEIDEILFYAGGSESPSSLKIKEYQWGGEIRVEIGITVEGASSSEDRWAETGSSGKGVTHEGGIIAFSGEFPDILYLRLSVKLYEGWTKHTRDHNGSGEKLLLIPVTGLEYDFPKVEAHNKGWFGGDYAKVSFLDMKVTPVLDPYVIIAESIEPVAAPGATTVNPCSTSDVNADGQVNVTDMILVSNAFGQTGAEIHRLDVNGDGIVSIADLVQVAQHLTQLANPTAPAQVGVPSGVPYETIQGWIDQARLADDGSLTFRQGIANLELLLTLIIPEKTALLHNYPNPFNPETWIPYHLTKPAEVTLRIYAVDGKLVRTLALGHQAAGYYQNKSRAAYWDGRNNVGEPVASGIYFYTLTAGNFAATRKMLILK